MTTIDGDGGSSPDPDPTSADGGETTVGVGTTGGDDPTTTSDDGSSEVTGIESESSGEPPPPECPSAFFDDFDGDLETDWFTFVTPGLDYEEMGSLLSFPLTVQPTENIDSVLTVKTPFDLTHGYVRVKVEELPPVESGMELRFQAVDDTPLCPMWFHIRDDGTINAVQSNIGPYDPAAEWFQFRFDGPVVYVETSTDGLSWDDVFGPIEHGCPSTELDVQVGGWAQEGAAPGSTISYDSIEVCTEAP